MIDFQELRASLLALACVGLVCAVLIVGIRLTWRPRRRLPPQFYRPVPWTGAEVCLALVLITTLVPPLVQQLVLASGLLDPLYGFDFKEILQGTEPTGLGTSFVLLGRQVKELAGLRLLSWEQVVAVPCEAALVLFFFRRLSATRPADLGLTADRLAADTVLGATAWLVVTPVVFLIDVVVEFLYAELVRQAPQEHPLTRLVQGPPVDWALLLFLTLAAAPLIEELLFRGILQQWLSRRPWGGWAALIGALVLALLSRAPDLLQALARRDFGLLLVELAPAWFVLVLAPGMFLMDRLGPRLFAPAAPPPSAFEDWDEEENGYAPLPAGEELSVFAARAWYGVAVLFAAAHSGVWPSPIPLFFLALGLGWVALRTQSLVPSILLHSLFNAVTCLLLVFLGKE